MKIIQINVVYGKGSTGKIVFDLHNYYLHQNHNSLVLFARGNNGYPNTNVRKIMPEFLFKIQSFFSKLTGYSYAGNFLSTSLVIIKILFFKPDIVHLHSINGSTLNFYRILHFLKSFGIKTVITAHAEFVYTAGCSYTLGCEKWKNGCGNCPQYNKTRPFSFFFDKSDKEINLLKKAYKNFSKLILVSVSEWVMENYRQFPELISNTHKVINNGLNTNVFKLLNYNSKPILDTKFKYLLHVTSNFEDPIKGGNYILALSRLLPNNYKIVVVGNSKTYDYPNIIFLGKIYDQDKLAQLYNEANLTIIVSKKETYSMICAESLCCGTPVVGFLAGGPESISIKKYSEFVQYGNLNALYEAIIRLSSATFDRIEISNEASITYSIKRMADEYLEVYKNN